MTFENALYFIAGGITTFLIMLWIAGHTELIATLRRKIHSIWEPLQHNFGEKEEQPYVDTHAPHVTLVRRILENEGDSIIKGNKMDGFFLDESADINQ
jgi:hypothetical protein